MRVSQLLSAATGVSLLATGVGSAQQNDNRDVRLLRLEAKVASLEQHNQTLSKALAHANKQEAEASRELDAIRLDLEALGTYP